MSPVPQRRSRAHVSADAPVSEAAAAGGVESFRPRNYIEGAQSTLGALVLLLIAFAALFVEGVREAITSDGLLLLAPDKLGFGGWICALGALAFAAIAALTPKRGGPMLWLSLASIAGALAASGFINGGPARLLVAIGALLVAAAITSGLRRLFAQAAHPARDTLSCRRRPPPLPAGAGAHRRLEPGVHRPAQPVPPGRAHPPAGPGH